MATSPSDALQSATRQMANLSTPAEQPLRLVVAVLTYQRTEHLRNNLAAVISEAQSVTLDSSPAALATVIVVDNDPRESARQIVEQCFPEARYVCEPIAGIAAARNRAITEAYPADLLAFIDDDEKPRPEWLRHLIGTWSRTGAAAVPGRVVSQFSVPPERWILAGEFFERPKRASGTHMTSCAAGNLLLDLRQVRDAGLEFEEPFGATGGEDSLFGRRLSLAGYDIVWCNESVVEDLVPAERLSRSWVLQRAFSQGNLVALIDCYLAVGQRSALTAKARRAVGSAVYMFIGCAELALGYLSLSSTRRALGLRRLCRGLGMLAGLSGIAHEQYARRPDPDKALH